MDMQQIIALDIWMIIPLFVFGSLMHFAFNWSKHNRVVAIFAAVNESYWEHIKIAFWPIITLYFLEFILGGYRYPAFLPAKTIALYAIPVSMVSLVFIYKHYVKRNILALDISIFLVSVALSQIVGALLFSQLNANFQTVLLSSLFFLFICVAFLVFSIKPPKEPDIFIDPITSKYGLKGHK